MGMAVMTTFWKSVNNSIQDTFNHSLDSLKIILKASENRYKEMLICTGMYTMAC